MLLIRIIIVIVISVAILSKAEWHQYNGHAYEYTNDEVSWTDGETRCRTKCSYLVNIEDAEENAFLVSTYEESTLKQYWIGLFPVCDNHDHYTQCWRWTEDKHTEISYHNWNTGNYYPDNHAEKTSVLITFESDSEGKWRNIKPVGDTGANLKSFICEGEDPCADQSCKNGGICQIIDPLKYKCICDGTGFEGANCEIDINECEDNTDECKNGLCKNLPGSYECDCYSGYTGNICETDIDDCNSNSCLNGGSCIDGNVTFICLCNDFFTGLYCESDINECEGKFHECENGACKNSHGGYDCDCYPGYTGNMCDINIDDCKLHSCLNGGSCVDGNGTFTCVCDNFFTGMYCETELNCYLENLCNNGTCVDLDTGYVCFCKLGFTGYHCEIDINYCDSDPCLNDAICIDEEVGFHCECKHECYWFVMSNQN